MVSWLYHLISRIAAFYLAFLLAYSLTAPGYVFMSSSAEKIYAGENFDPDASLTIKGVFRDIFEAIKISLFGILVTVVALLINFIPAFGQIGALLLYTYYSTLLFIDYPASRRRWSLGKKLGWIQTHNSTSFRIGIFPALISMIPVLNIFFIALIFPLLTVYSTINFAAIELHKKSLTSSNTGGAYGTRN